MYYYSVLLGNKFANICRLKAGQIFIWLIRLNGPLFHQDAPPLYRIFRKELQIYTRTSDDFQIFANFQAKLVTIAFGGVNR